MKPRIAILTNYPADFTSFTGGVETATAALLEGLQDYKDDFEFHLVSIPKGLSKDIRNNRDGIYFHFLSTPSISLARPRLPFRILKGLRKLQDISPSLIHCQDNMPLALSGILSGYPRLFTVHGIKRHEASKRDGWEKWSARTDAMLERYVYNNFQSFICISDYTRQVIGNKKKLFHVPNPVRSAFFQIRHDKSVKSLVILFIGSLIPLKRPMAVLHAHHELRERFPGLQTVICGIAEDKSYLLKLHQQATDGVYFAGRAGEKELIHWLSQATVLVLPSMQENLPLVIGEAMAAGVPVVASPVGGVLEMVRHGETGFLCNRNASDLTKWLEILLSNQALQSEMGLKAHKKALNSYHPSRIARQTVEVYQMMLGGKNSNSESISKCIK